MSTYFDLQIMLNFSVALLSILLSTLLALRIRFGVASEKRPAHYLWFLYTCLICFSAANLLGQICEGQQSRAAYALYPIVCFADYLFSGMLAYAASGFLISVAERERKMRWIRILMQGLILVHITMLILSQFTGLFYEIDAQNRYLRSDAYPLSLIPTAMILLLDAFVMLRCGKTLTKTERIVFWSFILIPGASLILLIYVMDLIPLSAMAASLIMFYYLTERHTAQLYREQTENVKLQTEVMLSQIQPHFLYNSLGAIADLCDIDPQKAKQTTITFAQYLRGNMNALGTVDLIPFAQELSHTQQYLELQKVRFGDDLQVCYEIACTDFFVPTLSMQPLVENAVRHGIRQNPGGRGTLAIAAAETERGYEITVTDDGPGFDPNVPPDDKRMHVGLQNVRERLSLTCGGTLTLRRNPVRGMTAVIHIPKAKEE
ncbi:MAG: histidine kinase [Oscillospiraceae bacterium]|nr:histidine kinase [Oscillospiraceae bacterium]